MVALVCLDFFPHMYRGRGGGGGDARRFSNNNNRPQCEIWQIGSIYFQGTGIGLMSVTGHLFRMVSSLNEMYYHQLNCHKKIFLIAKVT